MDVKSSGSPCGFQHGKCFVSFANPGVGVFVTVFNCGDFNSQVCEFSASSSGLLFTCIGVHAQDLNLLVFIFSPMLTVELSCYVLVSATCN